MATSTANQPELFIQSPGTGAEFARNLEPPVVGGPQVDILERNLHLQNVLRLIPAINQSEGFLKHANGRGWDELLGRYPDSLKEVITGKEAKLQRLKGEAKGEFTEAFGLEALVLSGLWSRNFAGAVERGSYADFMGEFKHPSKERARNHKLLQLIRQEVVFANRQPAVEAVSSEEPNPQPALETLTHHQKLVALREDPRAAFIPATKHERTRALDLLSYFDQPEFPNGAAHRFGEIFIRRARGYSRRDIGPDGQPTRRDSSYGPDEALDAMRSLGHEMGDFYLNAVTQINNLRQLQVELAGLNPHISLAEALEGGHAGIAALLRFMDQNHFVRSGHNPSGVRMDVFRSHRNEAAAAEIVGKNKVIEDQYTGTEQTNVAKERLKKGAQAVTVGEAWKAMDGALANEMARARFWEARLRSHQQPRVTQRAGQVALDAAQVA